MPSKDPNDQKTIPLNIQLSHYDKKMLESLARDTGKGMATILREAIKLRYLMRFNNDPSCSDGQACKCPQMHRIQRPEELSNADLLALGEPADGSPA